MRCTYICACINIQQVAILSSLDYHTPAPSQTTVPKLNNPQDVSVQTAYRGRLSSCNSRKNMWDAASHVEAS
eukprot:jgi/Botrbrau1/22173/Bobra.168_1s0005.1